MRNNNITVFLEVFNEEHRLEACLKSFQWADELVVFVKKSDDHTYDIAKKFATHVYAVDYCEASENFASNVRSHLSKEWCFFITASSLIDPELASELIKLTRDVNFSYDVIGLPYAMYVFGITGQCSPWGASHKYSLIRRSALRLTDVLHNEIGWHGNNVYTINAESTVGRFYHLTHANPDELFLKQMRYVKYESKYFCKVHGNKAFKVVFVDFLRSIGSVALKRRSLWRGRDGFMMSLTYISYFMMRMIYAWYESRLSGDPYEKQRMKLLEKWANGQSGMNPRNSPSKCSLRPNRREKYFSLIWTLLLPVRFYLRLFPFHRGKGILLRNIVIPLLPPTEVEFELKLPGRGKLALRYREVLGLSSLLYGTFELAELNFVSRYLRSGDNAMDIGANIGIFSVHMGEMVDDSGRVFAFEPAPSNLIRLQANIDSNGLGQVQVIPCALGGVDGQMVLHLATDPAYPSLIEVQSGLADGTGVPVQVRRLDSIWEEFGMPQIAFVKLDVEGSEVDVIRGASNLLQFCHPTLLVEANSPEQLIALREVLVPYGYQVTQPAGFAPHNHLFFHAASVASGRPHV